MNGENDKLGDLALTAQAISRANRHEDSYVGSLGYYLLTGRKGARLFENATSKVVVAQHPHIEDRLLVFPEIEGDGSLTAKILQDIEAPKNGIQLARHTDTDIQKLISAAKPLASYKDIVLQEIEEDILDWKFPVRVLDTQHTSEMKGVSFGKVRNKFNKASERLSILPLDAPNALAAMRASLMFWAGAMIYTGKETGHSITDFYDVLFSAIKMHPNIFAGFVIMDGEEPAGFSVWDVTGNTANSLACLSRRSIKGMSEFANVSACKILHEKGVKYYNMGGSETESLDRHKIEYQPKRSIKLKSYEVSVRNKAVEGIQSFNLPSFHH